jgi:uncharacterized protein YhaN
MPEQDVEMQILEELQKLKEIVSKLQEAENAYRNSSELLDKTSKQYSDLSGLKDELNAHSNTTRENLQKTFSIWEQASTKKMDYLNEEIVKLRIGLPQDVSPQFSEVNEQVRKINNSINSISEEFAQLKKRQVQNSIYVRVGLFLIAVIGFIVLVFK